MRKTRKPVAAAMCALILALGVNATYAYLTDSESVTNTFTVGNVGISLTETDSDEDGNANANVYKMIPGQEIAKDPKVIVDEGSEDCWLFVKVEESSMTASGSGEEFIIWGVDGAWTELSGVEGVWYAECDADAGSRNREFDVLEGNKVQVNPDITKGDMDELAAAGKSALPKLTVTAYAVQKAGFAAAELAWDATFGA